MGDENSCMIPSVGDLCWPHFANTNIQTRCGKECFTIKYKQDVGWNAATLDTTSS
ncbi:hypothetical protein A2U01_0085775, partial [Trifolium medium]|nr:hypothetical protein [Trifolium medium]